MKKTVDLIVPCYNEGPGLRMFYQVTAEEIAQIDGYSFRFLFIDDGSSDNTPKLLEELAAEHPEVQYLSFSRNFGKEAGIFAGLKNSSADYTVVIDADLQHPPSLIRPMLEAVDQEGYDSCSARRVSRKGEPRIRSFFARSFYKLINKMSDVEIVDGAVDYRMMNRRMVSAILQLSEVHRFTKGIFAWVGFRTKWIEFKNVERIAGETKWSFWKLVRYAVGGIVAFTTAPLRFAAFAGAAFSLLSLLLFVYELAAMVFTGGGGFNYQSVTLIVLLLLGGIVLLVCGIMGEYIAGLYVETKKRPVYIEKCSTIRNEDRVND